MFDFAILLTDASSILTAVPRTLGMAVLTFVAATVVGGLFALVERRRVPVLRQLLVLYKFTFKGVPMVIVIFLAYYGLPPVFAFLGSPAAPNWIILVIAVTACVSAFQAELVKGALNSFDTGQSDAAHSLGYRSGQLFRRIMFPQVIVAAIPDLANSVMLIMKALSLGFAIEVVDIFAQSQLTAALNFFYLESFAVAVVIYMVIAYLVTRVADLTERYLRVRT